MQLRIFFRRCVYYQAMQSVPDMRKKEKVNVGEILVNIDFMD